MKGLEYGPGESQEPKKIENPQVSAIEGLLQALKAQRAPESSISKDPPEILDMIGGVPLRPDSEKIRETLAELGIPTKEDTER